mgnify:CR=1 FL=1
MLFRSHIIVTSKREVIDNINNIPFPAWHLFPPISRYRRLRGVTKRPYVPLITSRGCPYNCNWCTKNIHGYKFRARSPENIFEEIKHDYQRYGAREFIVMDDVFTLDYMRVKKLCYLIVKSGMDIFLNIYNGVRADAIDDSIIKFLKAVGINRITVGVESGNQNIVNKIGKALNLKRVIEAVRLCRKNHLAIDGFFIIGHPYDTLRTIEQTIQFAIRADFDHAYFFLATPFMGTKLYDIIKTEGKLLYEFEKGSDFHIVQGKATCEDRKSVV